MHNLFSIARKSTKETDELGIVDEHTPFAIREAYRSLYSNVLYLNIEDKCKKIAITSAISNEGKTTISTNLSINLAQNLDEKRVLLIDTDMRKPKVSKLLGLDDSEHGLSEYLAGIDDKPNFQYIEKHRLTVLGAGGQNVNPAKLISSQKMLTLIKDCEEQFDYVIIDTPPVNIVTDAVLLQGIVNGYIISTRADYSNVNELTQCVNTLNRVGAEIFGVVLSSVSIKAGRKAYSKYGYNRYSGK